MECVVPLDECTVSQITYLAGTIFRVVEELYGLDEDGKETKYRILQGPDDIRLIIGVQDGVFSLPFDESLLPDAWLVVDPAEESDEVTVRRVGSSETRRVPKPDLLAAEHLENGESYLAMHVFVCEGTTWRALPGSTDR